MVSTSLIATGSWGNWLSAEYVFATRTAAVSVESVSTVASYEEISLMLTKSNFINYYEKRYFAKEGSALAIKYGTRRAKLAGSHDESASFSAR